jgi:hypothetical protein
MTTQNNDSVCDSVLAELDAWLDGSMPQAARARVELHLAGCPECREIAEDARAVVPLARALPREVEPPRDLWPEIRARIEPRSAARSWWRPTRLALAAAVLLAVGGAVGNALEHQLAPPPTPSPAEAAVAFDEDVEKAAKELTDAVEVRRDDLDPQTLAIVDQNLEIIDQAIAEIRAALQRDPADGRARDALVAAYNQKVRLLQAVLRTRG